MNNGYKFAELARGESLQSPDVCDCCGREGLKKTVKLINPAGRVVWFGTGCAARAMGCDEEIVRAARKDAQTREEANAKADLDRERAKEDARWQAFLNERAGASSDRFAQISKLGGFKAARAAYKESKV